MFGRKKGASDDAMKLDIKRTLFVGFGFMGIMCLRRPYVRAEITLVYQRLRTLDRRLHYPLRSQANALITLMGGAGGLASIVLYTVLAKKRYQSHIALFCTLGGVMLLMLLGFILTVRENTIAPPAPLSMLIIPTKPSSNLSTLVAVLHQARRQQAREKEESDRVFRRRGLITVGRRKES